MATFDDDDDDKFEEDEIARGDVGILSPVEAANLNEEGVHPDHVDIFADMEVEGEGEDEEGGEDETEDEWFGNLAEGMSESDLGKVASYLLDAFREDQDSRAEWDRISAKGINLLGVTEEKDNGPFKGASRVIHPVIAEAQTQFQARAIAEMWPAGGPVKVDVVGKVTPEKTEQQERVKDFMNYQYTYAMKGAFEEVDQMLYRLPLDGSGFKKLYWAPLRKRLASIYVPSADLVVPYSARSLAEASRITHSIEISPNDLKKLQRNGFYRSDINLGEPVGERDDGNSETQDAVDSAEGRDGEGQGTTKHDKNHIIREMHVEYDMPGFEDDDGIALPYVVAIDRDSQKILSIRRNWAEDDENAERLEHFIHYKFLPGLGFYGFGLLHTIGGLGKAASGILRALIDAGAFANLPGGFKAKDTDVKGGALAVGPGEWADVGMTSDELKKAFFPLPYKEPSQALFNLLGFLIDAAQRFAGTTEALVGDADNRAPVGTTVALIEQGSKVFSAIHKRLHHGQGQEFRLAADLFYANLEDGPYPYDTDGDEDRVVMRDDFDGRVDVVPVSDPNVFSSTQRIAQGQGVLQLEQSAPELYDKREVHKRILSAMNVSNVEALMPDKEEATPLDPVSENAEMMTGKAVKAFPYQEHQAHIVVLDSWYMALPKEGQGMLQGIYMAHRAEHMMWDYRLKMEQQMGVQLPPAGKDGNREPLPPEIERQLSMMAARATMQGNIQMPPFPQADKPSQSEDADMAETQAKIKRMMDENNAKIEAQLQAMSANIKRDDAESVADSARKDRESVAESARKDSESAAETQRKMRGANADLVAKDAQNAADISRKGKTDAT